jgi:hypothetical protein
MSSFMFWRSVQEAAENEASASPLPGFYDGPADAYRHIVGTAELRRRFGWATAYSIATGNEMLGTHLRNHPAHLRRMDDHNNAIGLAIGAEARSYEDVVRRAREAIDRAIVADGSGQDGTPLWLPEGWSEPRARRGATRTLPVNWPTDVPSAGSYRFGDDRFSVAYSARRGTPRQREAAILARLAEAPTEEWSEADVRAVIGSATYRNSNTPGHAEWRARVQSYFQQRVGGDHATGSIQGGEDECTGFAQVRAHTRSGPSGPVQVSAHNRSVSCD